MKANGRARFRYHIRNTAPIELPERQLRLDPYLFGVWLGDGSKAQATLSCHADDATHYIPLFEAQGFKASPRKDKGNTLFIHFDRREILTTQCQRGHVFAEVGQAKTKRAWNASAKDTTDANTASRWRRSGCSMTLSNHG